MRVTGSPLHRVQLFLACGDRSCSDPLLVLLLVGSGVAGHCRGVRGVLRRKWWSSRLLPAPSTTPTGANTSVPRSPHPNALTQVSWVQLAVAGEGPSLCLAHVEPSWQLSGRLTPPCLTRAGVSGAAVCGGPGGRRGVGASGDNAGSQEPPPHGPQALLPSAVQAWPGCAQEDSQLLHRIGLSSLY